MFEKIKGCFPSVILTKSYDSDALVVPAASWKELCCLLKKDPAYEFNMLVCISAVDLEQDGIEVFAHIRSLSGNKNLIVKCIVPQVFPQIDSLCEVWQSAELYEDEIYDLFGVEFTGHPFLRRLFLDDDFTGHPLKKNYGKVLEHSSR